MRVPIPPEYDFDEKAITDSKIRFQIWTLSGMLTYIFFYLCFRQTTTFTWLVKFIFIGGIIFVIYLTKRLQAQIRPVASQLPPPREQPTPIRYQPSEKRPNIGFSEETVRKALPLFRQRFENFDEQSLVNKYPSQVNYLPRIYENRYETLKKMEQDNQPYQPSPRQPERTIFESLPTEWPKRWANIQPSKDIRSLSPFYRETNLPLMRETSRLPDRFAARQSDQFGTALSRQISMQPNRTTTPLKTYKRTDSKVSLSKAKQSVFSRHDLRRDYIPEYEAISASEQALNSSLIALNVNLDKFYIWAFSNLQVWLAYDFIPEFLERNFVC